MKSQPHARVLECALSCLLLVSAVGCQIARHGGALEGRAADEWTRSYPLAADGEVQIIGANGSVDVQGGPGTSVEVRAERIARASTDRAARELLPRIEIIASPPGKRLQSVQLLSGGEKALTAIALMFGMFKYKPSPFCLLDEIDAPLDDANIGRFVEMLRSMQQHTQFILITHNRKTMEIADRLYGVTMEEPGVSKLISVQLH